MLYTSGTSGTPKGVMLPHRALVYMARLWAFRPVEVGDRVYQVLPISHSYGLCSYLFGALNMGCQVELASRFDPEDLRRAFREGVALFQGVPAMYARYLDHLLRSSLLHEAPALKAISTGGSPLDPDLKRRVEAVFGLELRQAYGLTEAGPTVTIPDSRLQASTALGRPGPDAEVRLVDVATGEESRSGAGEMWVRTPGVMKGYFRDPEATEAVLATDGWLRTGDIVRSAPDGVLHIAGRAKDVIIRSGFNVYPAEVEAVLLTHPQVISAAVVGTPAAEGDEAIVAFVELTRGAEVGLEELRSYTADRLAGYKRPSQIRVLPEMPLTVSGKVATQKLRELAGR
jgi:acyl-CoA synthetase (AMP-forming)/AMP-acid ligase II